MNNLWLLAVLALCLPLLLVPLALPPELGGPAQTLPALPASPYQVRAGDTLSAIAARFGVPVAWIMASNDLTSPTLYPGQHLLIPRGGVLHTVRAGETVASIAQAYGVSAEALRRANGLVGEPRPGTRLFVPEPKTVPLAVPRGAAFQWPVRGPISSGFGPRIHPVYNVPSFHTGIDLAVPEGTAVRAAAPGRVAFAGWHDSGFGLLVVLDHENGYETYYAHLGRVLVSPGQYVQAGDVIALSGNTGLSTGPHLHFEVRYLGTPVDPRPLLP
ncbi:MAG: M23 family metallopeptidase [Candidatus Bipolaricaulota bacterium]|nr:M23 family metallopeptidase [Candidatus Bipolaricaulota bacterium]MCX7844272.1 M23 family metallopeptidase [Candidatus Bipolaricaulota bacterium]MDW8151893.1 M23 family metallopeptidase [Candidatus Bipolaricaulota bacterium]